jgi:ABC-type Fe3+ transport system permease subunit
MDSEENLTSSNKPRRKISGGRAALAAGLIGLVTAGGFALSERMDYSAHMSEQRQVGTDSPAEYQGWSKTRWAITAGIAFVAYLSTIAGIYSIADE